MNRILPSSREAGIISVHCSLVLVPFEMKAGSIKTDFSQNSSIHGRFLLNTKV